MLMSWSRHFGIMIVLVASWASLALADLCDDQCVKNAVCVNGTCQCDDGYSGEPYFSCYNASESRQCRMLSDPVMQNFRGERLKLSFIGMARVAEFTISREGSGLGSCKFVLGVWTERFRGKFFIGGFHVELDQVTDDGLFENIGIRISGSVDDVTGVSSYKLEYRPYNRAFFGEIATLTSQSPGTQNMINSSLGCRIIVKIIEADFLEAFIECCDITIGLRPFNPNDRQMIPGFYVRYKELGNNVTFDTWDLGYEPLCLGPQAYILTQPKLQPFTGCGGVLTLPEMSDAENEFRHVLRRCPQPVLMQLYDKISFMLENAKFIQCIQDSQPQNEKPYTARNLFHVLRDAARYLCQSDRSACAEAIARIRASCSYVIERFPAVRAYVSQECDPP